MNDIVPFSFEDHQVRVVTRNGEPWFVGRDVASLLGYGTPAQALRDHCKGCDEMSLPSAGGLQRMTIIPERDVYRLIMRSKLPAAEQFEEWVVGTVLPSLRKHGGYVAGQEVMTNEQVLAKAVLVAQSVIEEKDAQLAAAAPKAQAFDRIAATEGSMTIMEAAKALQLPKSISPLYA